MMTEEAAFCELNEEKRHEVSPFRPGARKFHASLEKKKGKAAWTLKRRSYSPGGGGAPQKGSMIRVPGREG